MKRKLIATLTLLGAGALAATSGFAENKERGRGNREVSGTLGEGGPLIRARAANGGVKIRSY